MHHEWLKKRLLGRIYKRIETRRALQGDGLALPQQTTFFQRKSQAFSRCDTCSRPCAPNSPNTCTPIATQARRSARFAHSQWDPARMCPPERSIPYRIPLDLRDTRAPIPMGSQRRCIGISAQPLWDRTRCAWTTSPEPIGIARPAPGRRPRLRKLRAFRGATSAKSGAFRPIRSAAAL